jgi:hypothetical protein
MPGLTTEHQYGTKYNLCFIARLRNLNELEARKKLISRNEDALEIRSLIWVDVRNNPTNIFTSPFDSTAEIVNKQGQEKSDVTRIGPLDLDEIDLKIVDKLTEDGCKSFRRIGREIGVGTNTVCRRYQNLRNNNLIQATIQIDPTKLVGWL